MHRAFLAVACLAALVAGATLQPVAAQNDTRSTRPAYKTTVGGVPDTGQFLPNDAVLARVDDEPITVGEFIDGYFSSLIEFRPSTDSLGRVEFLDAMINKEVLAAVAREADVPLNFGDRIVLRGHERTILSNVLYRRIVLDSLNVTEEDIQREYETFKWQVRVRHILVTDGAEAQRIQRELKNGDITWEEAFEKYSETEGRGEYGELGWITRMGADVLLSEVLWVLEPGEISEPYNDPEGYHIFQCIGRREFPAPDIEAVRKQIMTAIRQRNTTEIADALQRRLAREAQMSFDTTNIRWAAGHFQPPSRVVQEAAGPNLVINVHLPHFDPADTSRVLARYDAGVITLGTLLKEYGALNAAGRPAINTVESMTSYLRAVGTDDRRVDLARSMGLDKDPDYVAAMAKREEQLRVEHLYEDSVTSKIYVPKEARQEYYEANVHKYVTWPSVRYASLYAEGREAADSLKALLEAGADAAELIRADSLKGRQIGAIQVNNQNQRTIFHQLLFNEMQVGEIRVEGPDQKNQYVVLQLLEFDPGRQLSFEESDGYIYESLQNMQAERLLNELIARHKKRFEIESHPELVMRIRLVDPAL